MSPVISVIFECGKSIPVQCLLFFLVLICGTNWYIYEYKILHPPVNERCSLMYPGFAVVIKNPVILSDGSIKDGNITMRTYPPGLFWKEGNKFRGCACSLRPCIKRCCPEGQILQLHNNGPYTKCVNATTQLKLPEFLEVISRDNISQKVNITNKHFSILDNDCRDDFWFSLQNFLLEDGRIWSEVLNSYLEVSNYCFNVQDNQIISKVPIICKFSSQLPYLYFFDKKKLERLSHDGVIVVAMVLHVITLVVFTVLPQLRTGYWKSIVSYVTAHLLRKCCYLIVHFLEHTFTDMHTNKLNVLIMGLGDLSTNTWLVVISFQIFAASRPVSVRRPDNRPDYKFITYSVFAWGVPLIITTIHIILLCVSITPYPVLYLINVGITTRTAVLVAQLISLMLGVFTLGRLRTVQRYSDRLQSSDSQKHNTKDILRWNVFLKVAVVTGIDYIIINILGLVDEVVGFLVLNSYCKDCSAFTIPFFIYNSLVQISDIRGVEMFFIFIFKKRVWKSLRMKPFL